MYENWKILKSEVEEKQDEYSKVAEWCNNGGKYYIELYIDENNVEWYRTVKNPEPLPPTKEEMRQARESAYRAEVDSPLMAEYNRKKTFNLFEDGEEEALLAKIEAKVEEIKVRYPYPVEESNISDNVLSEAKSEEVI